MSQKDYTRRDFHMLSAAALSGMLAAGTIGCGSQPDAKTAEDTPAEGEGTSTVAKHACRGLNECKGQGAKGTNECAGAGSCATVESHICGGHNKCKGQGGCGQTPGANECAGKGGCHVPMTGGMWKKARELFEERMKEKGVELSPAPEPAA